jgi:catechol 2,3-dioxygenase-like lactoylglutathione lyase family enzyme
MSNAVFGHVNLIAEDWRALAAFYEDVFGCEFVPPERDLSGSALDAATGVAQAHIRGAHLLLPGGGPGGPTLEVFGYETTAPAGARAVNAPGFAHIAFEVPDVDEAWQDVMDHGGSRLGEIVRQEVRGRGELTFAYVRDPEGNIIELSSWRQ